MDGTSRVPCSTWLIVSSSNSSSEGTERYLPLPHRKDSTFPAVTILRTPLDLGVEALRRGAMRPKSWSSPANKSASCEAAAQGPGSPTDPCRVNRSLADPVCEAVAVYAGTSSLGSAEEPTAGSATISTVLYVGSGCAAFVLRVTSASLCTDFRTACSLKAALPLEHLGTAMAHPELGFSSLAGGMGVASRAGVLVQRRA